MTPTSGPTTQQSHATAYLRAGKLSRKFFSLFARYDFPDRPAVLDEGGVIIASNHRSFFDLFLSYVLLVSWGETPRMMVRGSYFTQPGIGWLLRKTGCIPVHKGSGMNSLDDALEEIAADRSICIMPEGRLVPPLERPTGVGPARDGVGTLALKSGAPVLVVGVCGSDRVWPIGKPVPLPRRKRTNVLITTETLRDLSGSAEEVKDEIMDALGKVVRNGEAIAKNPAIT